MTTLLEFIISCYLGDPIKTWDDEHDGESYWKCPHCGKKDFHTMPDKPKMKHRFKCWNTKCGCRGDAYDFLKKYHPEENFGDRKLRVAKYKEQFKQFINSSPAERGAIEARRDTEVWTKVIGSILEGMAEGQIAGMGFILNPTPKPMRQTKNFRNKMENKRSSSR